MARRWVWRGGGREPPRSLAEAVGDLGLAPAPLVARLLWNRDVADGDGAAAFVRPTLARGLRSPLLMRDMERACRRLADALAAGEPIAVYGDYDVDGMTGAAQLLLFLRELGATVLLHVAHRGREGYGLHADALRALRASGARVLVTADCGTGDGEALTLAADLGLDVIVCDHHQAPVHRPAALALLNPLQAGCGFPFKGLSGAGVVFYLLMGLRAELRARGHVGLPDLRHYLDLVALGTVADVVPLRDENRVLVAYGLRAIDRTERPGLMALKATALVETASVHAIAFRLAPRLNAGGRLASAEEAVEMLTTADPQRARAIAATLEMHNAERRAIEDVMVREAIARVEAHPGWGDARSLVVSGEGWHPGVVGIVAARLAERFHRPAVVIALDGDVGRGSGRSVRGVALHDALAECRALLDAFGGHRQAVGLTVRRARVRALAEAFEAAVRRQIGTSGLEPVVEIDAETSLGAVSLPFARALATLEPHGPGNPEPALLARGVDVQSARQVGDPTRPHLRLRLRQDGRTLPAIGFGMGHLPVGAGMRVDVVFTPRVTRWEGADRVEVGIMDVRAAGRQPGVQAADIAGEPSVS